MPFRPPGELFPLYQCVHSRPPGEPFSLHLWVPSRPPGKLFRLPLCVPSQLPSGPFPSRLCVQSRPSGEPSLHPCESSLQTGVPSPLLLHGALCSQPRHAPWLQRLDAASLPPAPSPWLRPQLSPGGTWDTTRQPRECHPPIHARVTTGSYDREQQVARLSRRVEFWLHRLELWNCGYAPAQWKQVRHLRHSSDEPPTG